MDNTEVIPVRLLARKGVCHGHDETKIAKESDELSAYKLNSTRSSEFFIFYEFLLAWGDTLVFSRLWPQHSDHTELHRFPIIL